MIALVFLALGIGAFAAYELSPKTHEWVDNHVQAVKAALQAHDAASAHLAASQEMIASTQPSPPLTTSPVPLPPAAAQHVAAAAAQVASAAQYASTAKKAADAMGDHPISDAARRVADLLAALAAAKADETEATVALLWIQHGGGQSDLLQQRVATAKNREAAIQAQLTQLGQAAGAAIHAALSPPSSPRTPAPTKTRDPWA